MRRLSGAVGTAAIQCGVSVSLTFSPEVLLVHKSNVTGFSFPEQRGRLPQLRQQHQCAEPVVDSHIERLGVSGVFRSMVQSSLVSINNQSVRSGGRKHPENALTHDDVSSSHFSNIQLSCGPGESICVTFHFPLSSV